MMSSPHRGTAFLSILLVSALVATTAGCKAPSLAEVKDTIENEIDGVHLEPQMSFHLGRVTMAMTRTVARPFIGDEEPDVRDILRSVRRLAVASYEVQPAGALRELDLTLRIGDYLAANGWQVLVREQSEDERTWVMLREEDGRIDGLYIISLDEDELEMVRIDGKLDRAMAIALADDPDKARALYE